MMAVVAVVCRWGAVLPIDVAKSRMQVRLVGN